ncbi:MAG: septum site-determining protein MinC [Chloroflexota bacterium]
MNDEYPYSSQNGTGDGLNTERAASEVRAMHTRLVELLDSVTVVAESERSAPTDAASENGEAEKPTSFKDDAKAIGHFSTISPFPHESQESNNLESGSFASLNVNSAELVEKPFNHSSMVPILPSGEGNGSVNRSNNSGGAEVTMPNSELNEEADGSDSSISIKGRADGILIDVGVGSWRMLMIQLRSRLHQASGFFRGGTVTLNIGDRLLTTEEVGYVSDILEEHGMELKIIRSTSEETGRSAAAVGITAQLEQVEGQVAQNTLTNHSELQNFVYRGNLRSGQTLRRPETILILGDVNPGAQVISNGDVLIWGRLRGIAHAGNEGDKAAIISALSMEPTQLRIGESVAIVPESQERRNLFGIRKRQPALAPRPEVAYLMDDKIVIEPWDESKPGGIMAFRRS